jgi:glutamate/aspartate transport system substrate-binding protein
MKTRCLLAIATFSFCIMGAAGTAGAQELTGTLKKVRASGAIVLGVRDTSIPFSYLDDQQHYVGYHIDLCMKIVEAVRKKLGAPNLAVKMQPVASATRIPLMANGTIDLECGNTTNNLERQAQVAFAPTTFVTATRLLSKKASGVSSVADLRGKGVSSTSGSSNLKLMVTLNSQKGLGMNVMPVVDHGEGMAMLDSGRIAAYAMDDIILYSLAAHSKTPGDYVVSSEPLSVEPYGIMLRKDDPEFKKLVDEALGGVFRSGEINRLYAKWFQSAIPPKGVNLGVPMSDALKKAIARPTDSGDPAAYQ